MVEIRVAYQGELRCEAEHGPSSQTVVTDAPVDNQGKGESFSPTDLVATALGSCMLTIIGIVAERHGWMLTGTRATVTKEMIIEPVRRIGRLRVNLTLPPDFPSDQVNTLERAALTCPVHKSLHPDIEIPLEIKIATEA